MWWVWLLPILGMWLGVMGWASARVGQPAAERTCRACAGWGVCPSPMMSFPVQALAPRLCEACEGTGHGRD